MYCETFESFYKALNSEMPDLGEENTKQVALINYHDEVGRDFKHVSEWEPLRIWF
ncbi:hypothetical protein Hanom_Chr02g00132991 [Helianthus anomalus]